MSGIQQILAIASGAAAVAPSNLSYASPQYFVQNSAITPISPTVTGAVSSYSVSPSLPSGLTLNTASGVISGTPTSTSSATGYVITATNVYGSTDFTLTITVSAALSPPSGLSYPSPQSFTQGTNIGSLSPTVTGSVTSYTGSLPSGLSLNSSTGVITGTPTATSSSTGYVITASNGAGSTNFTLYISVASGAPSGLSYSSPQTFTQNTAISPLSPTVTGTITSYSGSLPAGLSLNSSTGVISGTPTTTSSATGYVITASNAYGSTNFTLTITVQIAAPSGLSYPSPQTFNQNSAISVLNPTVTGTVTSYSVSPALPSGISLNTSSGAISGTPTVASSATGYTITASNSTGSTNFTLTITVNAVFSPVTNTYTTGSGTETVPSGASTVTISIWGGGGSGGITGALVTNVAGGGGGGGYSSKVVSVSGGQTFSYSVGAGGTGVSANSNSATHTGNSGGSSTVSGSSVSMTATGGLGGGSSGGSGGGASGGTTNTSGTTGGSTGSVSSATSGSASYGGGSPSGGANATYSTSTGYGTAGNVPGGGSSGVSGDYDISSSDGATGQVSFSYT